MIEMKNVSFSYEEAVLNSLSFHVEAGEIAFLTGKSGEGKTTIFELLAGNLLANKGDVIIDETIVDSSNRKMIQKKVSRLTQPAQLMDDKTVEENLSYYLEFKGQSRKNIKQEVLDLLEQLQLSDRMKHFPMELSGGEQARLGLGLAIIKDNPILLIDEPSANLDPALSKHIIQLLINLADQGKSILVSMHDPSLITKGSKVIKLSEGQVEVTK